MIRQMDTEARHRLRPTRTTSQATRDLFEIIDRRGLIYNSIEIEAGVCIGSLSRWKSGRQSPTLQSLEAVAQVLGLTLNWRPTACR